MVPFEGLAAKLTKLFGNYGDAYQVNNEGSANVTYNNSTVDTHHNFSIGQTIVLLLNRSTGNESSRVSTEERSTSPTGPCLSPSDTSSGSITLTPSQRYVSLMLQNQLGYPMWRPSPNTPPVGTNFNDGVCVGDVGILRCDAPFDTLFNVLQSRNSPINFIGVPQGFESLIGLRLGKQELSHDFGCLISQPRGILSSQVSSDEPSYSIHGFVSSHIHGALLKLPKGARSEVVLNPEPLRQYIQKHWREWYTFAECWGNLDDAPELYIVTGFVKCCSWALAVFDDVSEDSPIDLPLTMEKESEFWRWGRPSNQFYDCDPRCERRSYPTTKRNPEGDAAKNQCVFIRGFWVHRHGGIGVEEETATTTVSSRGGTSELAGNQDWGSNNPYKSSSSKSSTQSTSGELSRHTNYSAIQPRGSNVFELELENNTFGQDLMILNPCRTINQFILSLLDGLGPDLLNSDHVAISDDSVWIDLDQELSDTNDLIRRVCSQYKFVVEQDAIYLELMAEDEKQHVARLESTSNKGLFPVSIHIKPSGIGEIQPSLGVTKEYEMKNIVPELSTREGKGKDRSIDDGLPPELRIVRSNLPSGLR
ncbi:hypothetical protein PQX77_020363 [Marasmius sp. AFHP31]|nr:hypothetical protein PQX77_020363 [Marasmius sp. AFHP31]